MEPIDDEVRRNLHEIISELHPTDPSIELGFPPEDLNNDWSPDALKYPLLNEVDDFWKVLKDNPIDEPENEDIDENIEYSTEQQEIIDILNLQIVEILFRT